MSDDCCEAIDTGALQRKQKRVLTLVLGINVATFLMMVAASILSGSSALLSGTLDNFGDAVTYALSFAVVGATSVAKAHVAFFKGLLILGAALVVTIQIGWRLFHPGTPIVETMGVAAILNLGANLVCLRLLMPYRGGDLNMASAWECSRNDVLEGTAVIVTAAAIWAFESGWPDIIVAVALLILFLRSAARVLSAAWRGLAAPAAQG
ncbi:MAG TPA: cation transporter [Gammaproteobacteria bacterium]